LTPLIVKFIILYVYKIQNFGVRVSDGSNVCIKLFADIKLYLEIESNSDNHVLQNPINKVSLYD